MLIALFGASSVGKSTLARALSARFQVDLRGCGDIVRERAAAHGGDLAAVSQEEHRQIDDETRVWCQQTGNRIVEGRFLDQVLHGLEVNLILVEITANEQVRMVRWSDRLDSSVSAQDIRSFDQEDAAFRMRAYGEAARLTSNFVLDTSDRTVGSCLEQLVLLTGWEPPG